MIPIDSTELVKKLAELRTEHRTLDDTISRFTEESAYVDDLMLRRLKKRKLQLKDAIEVLQSHLIPNLDA